MNSHPPTTAAMSAGQACRLARHVKAALLHLVTADQLAETAGVDMLGVDDGWSGYVTGDGLGPARAFRAALEAAEELDDWAIGNAGACGAGSETHVGTERWCQAEGGVLPLDGEPGEPVSAPRLQAIAMLADGLADVIEQARAGFRPVADMGSGSGGSVDELTTGELVRRAGFRLPDAAGQARQVARELRDTSATLERIAAVPADACRICWSVCPEHGNTISATGGTSWCRVPGCGRRWDYDRGDIPCPEPVRWRVTDQHGDGGAMCDGHVLGARTALIGGTVVPLDLAEGRRP